MPRTTPLAVALLLGTLGTAVPATAQTPAPTSDSAVAIGVRTGLHSTVLGEDRPLWIHLPPSYARTRDAYPVVYLLDGDAHFASVSAMVDFLARNDRAPEMIVVAIPNTKDRTHDLTPPGDTGTVKLAMNDHGDSLSNQFPTAGGSAKMRAFVTSELAPWVAAHYRTAPFRILVGHSFGGLFVLDALASEPRAFNAYVAISPSLWWDHGRFEQHAADALESAPFGGLALYMTTGEREGRDAMIAPAEKLASTIAHRSDGFRATYKVMPTETHGSNPFRTEYDALEWIFDGWSTPDSAMDAALARGDVGPLAAHNAALAKRFGYPIALSPDLVNSLAYATLQSHKLDVALKLFRYNTATTPDYANGWDSLADGLEAQGKLADAIAAQEKAVQVGDATHDPRVGDYRTHLERLRKAAAAKR
jgi:predicted alpha/beta superfamily hydrolase